MSAWKKPLRVIGLAFIFGYLGLAALAWLAADRMIHHPELTARRKPAGLKLIPGPDGSEIAVLHLANPGARFTLWFFHGNAEDLGDLEPNMRAMHAAGFSVLAFDYPGYGWSTGQPNEASLYAASRVVRNYLREQLSVPAATTIIYGRSLGGGPAVQMAVEERVAGLVVQSTFMSAFRVMTRWPILPFDQFRNLAKMPRVACPVLVMHGESDEVISVAHGRALHSAARGPKQALWVPAAGHNDFTEVAGEHYWQALREFSELCAKTPAW